MNILDVIAIIGIIISITSTLIIFYNHCKNNNFYNIFRNRNTIIPEINQIRNNYQFKKREIKKLDKIIIIKNPDNKIKIGIEKI